MSVDSDFTIRWRTPGVIDAAVRDPQSGVVDVRWTRFQGWSCSCADGPPLPPRGCDPTAHRRRGLGLRNKTPRRPVAVRIRRNQKTIRIDSKTVAAAIPPP